MSERKWRSCIAWAMLLLLQRGQHQQTPPEWIEHIGLVSLKSGCSKMGVWDEAEIILVELQKIMARSPAKKLIIAPESAFAHPLNNYPVFVSLWADYGLRECGLLIGSQREDQGVYNCAYFIKNGLIEQSYDKRKCLPFSEKPAGFFYEQIATFFSQESTQFKNGQQSCTVFNAQVPGMPFFQLRICSEFLCTHQAPAESLIVCLANDSWFCSQQGKNAMFSIAVLRAIQAKSAVLYVAHSIAAYIDQSGAAYLMKQ